MLMNSPVAVMRMLEKIAYHVEKRSAWVKMLVHWWKANVRKKKSWSLLDMYVGRTMSNFFCRCKTLLHRGSLSVMKTWNQICRNRRRHCNSSVRWTKRMPIKKQQFTKWVHNLLTEGTNFTLRFSRSAQLNLTEPPFEDEECAQNYDSDESMTTIHQTSSNDSNEAFSWRSSPNLGSYT